MLRVLFHTLNTKRPSNNHVMENASLSSTESFSENDYTHVGWIPCVGGHLDFGLMKPGISGKFTGTTKDSKTSCVNFCPSGPGDHHHRKVAIQSWVDWNDTFENANGKSRVCLIAEAVPSDNLDNRYLVGSILIYPKNYETQKGGTHNAKLLDVIHDLDYISTSWSNRNASMFSKLGFFLNAVYHKYLKKHRKRRFCLKKLNSWAIAQKSLDWHWKRLLASIPSLSDNTHPAVKVIAKDAEQLPNIYRVDFKVTPNGISFMKFNDLGVHSNQRHSITDEDKFVITRQAFYYLKYSLHTHKHHGHQQDAMTSIVQYNNDSGLRMLGQVKRELTGIKRMQSFKKQRHHSAESLGIISYAGSLCVALRESGFFSDKQFKRELARLESLKGSFESQHERV